MSIPIVIQNSSLFVSIKGSLGDNSWRQLSEALMEKSQDSNIDAAIVDISEVDVLDSFAARMLSELGSMLELQGLQTVIVGIAPEVAFTMVRLGLRLDDIHTALDFNDGMRLVEQLRETGAHNG